MSASPVNSFAPARLGARPRLLERYREFLPVTDATPVVSLGEGATPLIPARRLGASIGVPNLHVKFEGMNPTGSFKDRGMTVAISKAAEEGAKVVVAARSTEQPHEKLPGTIGETVAEIQKLGGEAVAESSMRRFPTPAGPLRAASVG